MDRKTLDEIRAREQAATHGPWYADGWAAWDDYINDFAEIHELHPDAKFIAHAREDIPALLDYIAKLEVENAELRARLEKVEVSCDSCRLFNTDSYAYYTYPCSECKCRARDSYEPALEAQKKN